MSVRLIVHDNATEDIVWGAVVGCDGLECERFTPIELLSFPIFVIRNHGPAWNDAAWTLPVLALLVPVLMAIVCWVWWEGWLVVYVPVGPSYPRLLAKARPGVRWADLKAVCWVESPRLLLYALATWAIVVDILETFAHFAIATQTAPSGSTGYTIFWLLVWHQVGALLASTALRVDVGARDPREPVARLPLEAGVRVGRRARPLLALLGARLLVARRDPARARGLLHRRGLLRLPVLPSRWRASCASSAGRAARTGPRSECKSTIYISAETDDTDCGYGADGSPPGLYLS